MRHEALGLKVGARFEFLQVLADNFEVTGLGELGDGDGEGDAVEVGLGSERSGLADVDDAVGVVLGFKKSERGPGFLFSREWGL